MFGKLSERSNLTDKQLLFWLGHAINPGVELDTDATTYGFHIAGELDSVRFQTALARAIHECDALKSVFYEDAESIPQQKILLEIPQSCEVLALDANEIDQWVSSQVAKPLDIGKQVFSSSLVRIKANRYLWLFKYHHLIGDATSVSILYQRVSELYLNANAQSNLSARNSETMHTYRNYIESKKNEKRDSVAYQAAVDFWNAKLQGKQSGKSADLYETTKRTLEISEVTGKQLNDLCRDQGLRSPAIGLLAILATSLFVESQSFSTTIGINLRDRPKDFERVFGLFVSTCPLRIEATAKLTFLELANLIRREIDEVSKFTQSLVPNPMHARIWNVLFNYLYLDFSTFAEYPVTVERHISCHSNKHLNFQAKAFQNSTRISIDLYLANIPEMQTMCEDNFLRVLNVCLNEPHASLANLAEHLKRSTQPRLSRRAILVGTTHRGPV